MRGHDRSVGEHQSSTGLNAGNSSGEGEMAGMQIREMLGVARRRARFAAPNLVDRYFAFMSRLRRFMPLGVPSPVQASHSGWAW